MSKLKTIMIVVTLILVCIFIKISYQAITLSTRAEFPKSHEDIQFAIKKDSIFINPGDGGKRESLVYGGEARSTERRKEKGEEKRKQTLSEEKSVDIDQKTDMNVQGGARKVVEFAYMRGGSSIIGQVFNQMTKSIYWYEPLDSFYTSYAGIKHWTTPYDITHNSDTTPRNISTEELNDVGQFLSDLLNCNLKDLNSEILSCSSDTVGKQHWYKEYNSCLRKSRVGNALRCTTARVIDLCKPRRVQGNVFNPDCVRWIEAVKGVNLGDSYDKHPALTTLSKANVERFIERQTCINHKRRFIDKCVPILQKSCDQSAIRSTKILRTRMSSMEPLLDLDPDVLIIHVIRDPRGTMMSRKKIRLLAKSLRGSMEKEGQALCQQMIEDYEVRVELQKKYPRNIMQVRYEDLASDMEGTLRDLLTFVRLEMNPEIVKKMTKMMFSSKNGSGFSQVRSNATQVSQAWRSRIPATLKRTMDRHCTRVYQIFNYDL